MTKIWIQAEDFSYVLWHFINLILSLRTLDIMRVMTKCSVYLQFVAERSQRAAKAAPSFRTEDGLWPWIELALG